MPIASSHNPLGVVRRGAAVGSRTVALRRRDRPIAATLAAEVTGRARGEVAVNACEPLRCPIRGPGPLSGPSPGRPPRERRPAPDAVAVTVEGAVAVTLAPASAGWLRAIEGTGDVVDHLTGVTSPGSSPVT